MTAPHTTSAPPVHLVERQRAHTAAPTVAVLALQAADQASNLTQTLAAFRALEHLTTPTGRDDSERLEPTRTEMSELLRVLNNELARQIEAMASATDDLRTAAKRDDRG